MALYYELPVYRDVYKLILMIFECSKDFSKEYKYTLGQDMKRDALQLVRNIYRANKSANKKEYLEAFLDKLSNILCVRKTPLSCYLFCSHSRKIKESTLLRWILVVPLVIQI